MIIGNQSQTCFELVSSRTEHSNMAILIQWAPIFFNNLSDEPDMFSSGPREGSRSLSFSLPGEERLGSGEACGLWDPAHLVQVITTSIPAVWLWDSRWTLFPHLALRYDCRFTVGFRSGGLQGATWVSVCLWWERRISFQCWSALLYFAGSLQNKLSKKPSKRETRTKFTGEGSELKIGE